MTKENLNAVETCSATVIRGGSASENLNAVGVYRVECVDKDGNVKWIEETKNLIPYQGKASFLSNYFAGSSWTPTFYMSLITAGSATTASTYASPTVTEVTNSIIAARLPITWEAAGATGSIAAVVTSFSILAAATITGNMVVLGGTAPATVGDTAGGGVLFSAASFVGGAQTVNNGDTLNVQYSVAI